MKFDTIIMGGGLAGLTAGIELAGKGLRTAIITSGQSALHFSSGSFELLGYDANMNPIENPLEGMKSLPDNHPYKTIGLERVKELLPRVRPLMKEAGIAVSGSDTCNHWRLSPIGVFKHSWLTIDGYCTVDSLENIPFKNVALVAIDGMLDFFPSFLASGLAKRGIATQMVSITTPAIDNLRRRSAIAISRSLHDDELDNMAATINTAIAALPIAPDAILLPAVAAGEEMEAARRLREKVSTPLYYICTPGTSVLGVQAQKQLQKQFRRLGGALLPGDTVVKGHFADDGSRLLAVETHNFGSDLLKADEFIFAAGSFFSKGLKALPDHIEEPVFDLQVDAPRDDRALWFDKNIFNEQPYMAYGVAVEGSSLRALRHGKTISNIRVIGSSLPGAQSLREGSGAGVSLLSALHAADQILKSK